MRRTLVAFAMTAGIALASPASAALIGQVDTFQDGTTDNWVAGGGPNGQVPPVPPKVQLSGGPGGANDAFLAVTGMGGSGPASQPGSRLTTFNIFNQWADNYLTNGVHAIAMDLRNLGASTLTIRLKFENPFAGGDEAVTNVAFTLPSGDDWTHVFFPIGLADLTALDGTVAGALGNTSVLRIMHAPGLTDAEPVAGILGIDNITALATVPEPATLWICAIGVLFAGLYARKRA
jgi:hypothetical protein